MAKPKAPKAQPGGQKTLMTFFGGSKKASPAVENVEETDVDAEPETPHETEAEDGDEDVEMIEASSDVDMDASNTTNKKLLKSSAPETSDLPPISDIPAIFDDLVSHIPEIREVAEHVAGRKLRVATMCSGTESPLLALELIQKSILEQHGVNFNIEHVFSCEIEPFKQAYIERNFRPPLLFRDVCELGDAEAYVSQCFIFERQF